MTQREILAHESAESNEIHLYQEGMFWKAYEYSAYRFTFGICAFSPKKKFIKAIGRDMVSIGFPKDSLKKHAALFDLVSESEKACTIIPKGCAPPKSFDDWREEIPLLVKGGASKTTDRRPVMTVTMTPQPKPKSEAELIVDEIRCYNMESKTPMECMLWLSQLKARINHGEL